MIQGQHISPIRLDYHEGVLCVESGWLIESGLMSKSNYKALVRRNDLSVVRRGCRNTPALVSFEMMPTRFKERIVEQYGSPYQRIKENRFANSIQRDARAAVFFSTYRLPDGRSLPQEIQWRYIANAEVMNTITEVVKTKASKRRALGGSIQQLWEKIAEDVSQLDRKEYPHNLPGNHRRLRSKHKQFVSKGYGALVSKKFGNDNSRKVSDKLERLILSLYCLPNKPYSSTTVELYMLFLGGGLSIVDVSTGEVYEPSEFYQDGLPIIITEATAWNYINAPKNRMIVDKYRMSALEYNNTHTPHHHRHAPSFALSKVSMDDRDLPRKMLDGNRVKAYYAYDVLSGCVIGKSYSRFKDNQLFIDCVRDMFRYINNKDMGIPMEVEVEHHLVNNFKDDLMKAGNVFPFVRWSNPGNAQEKHAENFNRAKKYGYEKRYQDGIGRFYSKLEANRTHSTKVFDAANNTYKDKKYEFEALVADDLEMVEKYNNGLHRNQKLYPGMTRMEVFEANKNPDLAKYDEALLSKYIGDSRQTSIVRSSYVTVLKGKYLIPSSKIMDTLQPNNYSVEAYWIPNGKDKVKTVYLYQNGNFICSASDLETYNSARGERTEKDDNTYLEQSKYVSEHRKLVRDGQDKVSPITVIEHKPGELEEMDSIPLEIMEEPIDEMVDVIEEVHDSGDTRRRALMDI